MNRASDPDVVKITEVFLIPSSFLVAALGTADTNPHRAVVSLIGLVVSVMWQICSREALNEHYPEEAKNPPPRRIRIMSSLPVFFIVCWLISLAAHLMLWGKPLGTDLVP
ncbi:MAG: hypothetical protein JNM43_12970 [Planctomycetaceae bacterium]|nr:hypothetical protein [Planctomycetaceae bacterium]